MFKRTRFGKRSKFRNVLFLEHQTMDKVQKLVLLSIIHHRRNQLQLIQNVCLALSLCGSLLLVVPLRLRHGFPFQCPCPALLVLVLDVEVRYYWSSSLLLLRTWYWPLQCESLRVLYLCSVCRVLSVKSLVRKWVTLMMTGYTQNISK
jgi:hypothetical protein